MLRTSETERGEEPQSEPTLSLTVQKLSFPHLPTSGRCGAPGTQHSVPKGDGGLPAVLFEVFFDFEGGHAAGSGGGDGLAITAVLHVSAGVDAGDAREDVIVGFDVAVFIEIELAGEHGSVGDVSDAEEETAEAELGLHASDGVEKADTSNFLLLDAEDLFHGGVGDEGDFGVGDGAVEHDARGAEVLAAVDERDFGGEAGEEESFFHSGVAAADDSDLLAGEEEAIAGGAGADAVADERLLRRQAEPACRGSTGDDESAGVDDLVAEVEREGVLREIGSGEMAEAELRAETRGLLADVFDELGALYAIGPAGKVLDQRGDGELAAGLVAFQHQRLEVGAGGVDGRGEPGAAGAEDDGVVNVWHGPELSIVPAGAEFPPCRNDGDKGGAPGIGSIPKREGGCGCSRSEMMRERRRTILSRERAGHAGMKAEGSCDAVQAGG